MERFASPWSLDNFASKNCQERGADFNAKVLSLSHMLLEPPKFV